MKIFCLIFALFAIMNLGQDEGKLQLDFLGEKLSFKMEYLNLSVAKLDFDILDAESGNYLVRVHAKSTGSASLMFKLDNVYETYFDRQSCLPNKIVKKIAQKNIQHELKFLFDHKNGVANLGDSISWKIPEDCFDYFSMLYFLRRQRLQPGDIVRFHLDSEYIISKVEARVLAAQESIKVPAGKFRAIKLNIKFTRISPHSRPWRTDLLTNRLASPGSELTLWLSDDDSRLPLKIAYHQSQMKTQVVLDAFSRGRRQ
ncbi:MAG: DUF3108 domain-containing protein [candidate division KSB1 bacterium]|nr:DUF3108 domain-containing protein [candidate division KSB1 bacterium]MDZ7356183.1 DUF3108 domain-containing protein [candidate division KSB1 bacterium]MDZ7400326.1 DUF3108 domain-containing protein [candidate division KSB1 bacterium]